MPSTGRVKPSASAPRLVAAPSSVDVQARFQTPPVHIYAASLDGPRAVTTKPVEGNEHYLLPRQKPPNPRKVVMQRELCQGGGRGSRATWAEAKPSTAVSALAASASASASASAATTMVTPLRTNKALPPEHRLPNSYSDAERRASTQPQPRGSTALCRQGRFDAGTAAVLTQVSSTGP